MKAAIVCNGMIYDYEIINSEISKYDFIICADGGMKHLVKMNIIPDVVIGDFDSFDFEQIKNNLIYKNTVFFKHPIEKNATDTQICIDYALKNGFKYITLFAALGGRVDHQLSNIFHLRYIYEKNAVGGIFSEKNIIYIVDDFIEIEKKEGFKLSMLPLTQFTDGVTTKGLYYPLENAKLEQGDSLGISNEFVDNTAQVSLQYGALLIILSAD